jgi:hypothetical protein
MGAGPGIAAVDGAGDFEVNGREDEIVALVPVRRQPLNARVNYDR